MWQKIEFCLGSKKLKNKNINILPQDDQKKKKKKNIKNDKCTHDQVVHGDRIYNEKNTLAIVVELHELTDEWRDLDHTAMKEVDLQIAKNEKLMKKP